MLIQNVLYSTIDLYIKKINQYLNEGYIISDEYKTYDKNIDDIVVFKCFDIKASIKTKSEFIISKIKYSGYLEFTYNKATNEVYVSKMPYIASNKTEVFVFTSDIAQIIVDKVKPYIPNEDIKTTFFSSFAVFAIDNKVQEIVPAITDTRNYDIINHIIDTISLEEKRIKQHALNLKLQKDREDRAVERAVSKKRRIYGLEPNDYEDQLKFYKVADQKICEVYAKKIEKIKRHLRLNESKYKEMLNSEVLSKYGSYGYFISSNMAFRRWAKENGIDVDKLEHVFYQKRSTYCNDEIGIEKIKEEWEEIKIRYIEHIYQHDLNSSRGILALVDFVKQEIMDLPELREEEKRIDNNTLYSNVVAQLASISRRDEINDWLKEKYDCAEDHPIFCSYNYSCIKRRQASLDNSDFIYTLYTFSRNIGLAIELLLQIRTLMRQLQYYLSILNEPSKAFISFKKDNNSWASIMQFPYFVRMGRDSHVDQVHDLFNLLMIKPGTLTFDDTNIRYFIQKGDVEKKVSLSCDRLVVAIPDSLQYHSLLKVIEYAHDRGKNLNFICQSPDLASKIKSILVNAELNARRYNCDYIKGKYFINVDPNYYDSFFVDTPSNKEFWHRYDYSSNYKYRRKVIYDLKTIIDICIHEYLKDNPDDEIIDNRILSEMILGGYFGNSEFDLEKFLLDKQGIDGRTLPDDSDKVLAFMQLYPNIWIRELPLIDNYKYNIEKYLEYFYEEFLRKKEVMLIFKDFYSNEWKKLWTKMYLSTSPGESLSETSDVRNMQTAILIFKDLFPDDWKNILTTIKKEKDFFNDLIAAYKSDPKTTKEKVLTLKKSRNWKKEMKLWLSSICDDDYVLPF